MDFHGSQMSIMILGSATCDYADVPDLAYFTPVEWDVIARAERHSLSSIGTVYRTSSDTAIYVDVSANESSACDRLEALRRAAVFVWHGRPGMMDQLRGFYDAGFSRAQGRLLASSIERRRNRKAPAAYPMDFNLRVMA